MSVTNPSPDIIATYTEALATEQGALQQLQANVLAEQAGGIGTPYVEQLPASARPTAAQLAEAAAGLPVEPSAQALAAYKQATGNDWRAIASPLVAHQHSPAEVIALITTIGYGLYKLKHQKKVMPRIIKNPLPRADANIIQPMQAQTIFGTGEQRPFPVGYPPSPSIAVNEVRAAITNSSTGALPLGPLDLTLVSGGLVGRLTGLLSTGYSILQKALSWL